MKVLTYHKASHYAAFDYLHTSPKLPFSVPLRNGYPDII